MLIVDVNILIYVTQEDAIEHQRVLDWWTEAVDGPEPIGLPWTSLVGFLRVSTNKKIYPRPLTIQEATERVASWIEHHNTSLVAPSQNHWKHYKTTLLNSNASGNLVTDAHFAALAISRDATLVSCDTDFARFKNLRWLNPLTAS